MTRRWSLLAATFALTMLLAACDDGGGAESTPDVEGADLPTSSADTMVDQGDTTEAPDTKLPIDDTIGAGLDGTNGGGLDASWAGDTPVDTPFDGAPYGVLTPLELHDLMETEDPFLINVYEPYMGEIPGTDVHIPAEDQPAVEAALGSDMAVEAIIYCRKGIKSTLLVEALVEVGYTHLRVLDGGMEAWVAAGYELDE